MCRSFWTLAEPVSNAQRSFIPWLYKADNPIPSCHLKSEAQRGSGSFRGVAMSPPLVGESPRQLKIGPPLWAPKPNLPDELSRLGFNSPASDAGEVPMPHHKSEMAPGPA